MYNKKLTVLSLVVLLSLTLSLVFPMGVLADDNTPPSTEVPEVVTPPEETPTQEPVTETIISPTDVATEAPVISPTDVATEAPVIPPTDAVTEVPVIPPTDIVAEVAVSETPIPDAVAADAPVVDAAATDGGQMLEILAQAPTNTDIVVLDQNGSAVTLASEQAADIVQVGDPIWCPNGVTPIASTGGCTASYTTLLQLVSNLPNSNTNGTIWILAGIDTSASPIIIDGNNANFDQLRNATLTLQGGWGGLGGTVVNPNTPSIFSSPISIINWRDNVTINNISIIGATGTGLTVTTRQDNITLNRVIANNNTVNGASLGFTSNGGGSITVNNSSFSNNGALGLNTNNNANGRQLTLNNVTFSGNTSGAYNHPANRLTINNCIAPAIWVVGVGCVVDTTPPTISAAITAGTGSNGWYRSNVTVHFTCTDNAGGSGITTCPPDQILSTEGASVSSTAQTAVDNAGNVSAASNVVTVKIDKTLPTIVAAANPAPGPAGWNNTTPVTVHFTCTDSGSGVATCPADQIFNASGTSTAQTTTDNAGNVSAASNTVTVKIDKTIPTISAAVSAGTLGSNGWYRSNVTIHFTCTDNSGGSGIATCPPNQILSTEGPSVSSTAQTAVDNAGNVSAASNIITVKIDKTDPTISAAITVGTPGSSGWYNSNVTVHFTCADAGGSGIASCPADQLLTSSGIVWPQRVTDLAGNQSNFSNFILVLIDTTPPTISAAVTAGPNGSNGWYKSNVSVHFTCADNALGSGIATCPPNQILSTDGPSVSSTAQTATDNAGNVSAASNTVTVKIDKTPPTIVAAATTSPTAAGWYNTNVTIHFTCTDDTSGILSCPSDQVLTASGTSTVQTTTDNAGNVSAASNVVTVQIDKNVPFASASASPAPNANGWNNTDVVVSFSGTDVGSGIASCTAPVTLSTEGSGQSASGTCTDNAGNVSNTASVDNINIDKTEPVITVANITNEATGPSGATVNYTAMVNDNLDSGITISCIPTSGSTFAITTTTVTCTSTDQADNTATSTFTVTVQDTTPPAIESHADISVDTQRLSGTIVNYTSPNTSDAVDGNGAADCQPPSGSWFPVGDTTVTCRAIDQRGNSSETTFVIHVVKVTKVGNGVLAGFVPVTGDQGIVLSCTESSSTLKMAGFEVTFTNLCGYSAVLTEAPEDSLFDALPDGNKYVSGIDVALLHDGSVVNPLPANTTTTLSFEIPSGMTGETLAILYWDPTANGGAGAWVEKSATVVGGKVTLTIDMPGTFVLVDKSTTVSLKDNSHVVTTFNGLYLVALDFFKQIALQ